MKQTWDDSKRRGGREAAAKGFSKEADVDVTIKPRGPDIAPAQVAGRPVKRQD